jgi:S1-C subfamily serine protease
MIRTQNGLSWARLLALTIAAVLFLGMAGLHVFADVIKLKDGTVLEGEVKRIGSSYQVTTKDGQHKLIRADDIESISPGGSSGSGSTARPGNTRPGDSGAARPNTGNNAGGAFTEEYRKLKERIDRIEEPVKAVTLWEQHLLRKDLSAGERAAAEKELAGWKKLYADGAEKIKNRWMWGEELKKLKSEASSLVEKAMQQEEGGQVLDAIRNYKQAIILYPNSFRAHYRLAFIKFREGYGQPGGNTSLREADRSIRAALRLEPELPAVLSSMGAVLFAMGKYEEGVEYMWKAVKKAETPVTVGNLLTALNAVPNRWLANNRKLRDINKEAGYLRSRYNAGGLVFIVDHRHGLDDQNEEDTTDKGPPGFQGHGSGFFISPDGYLLTNRHVATTDDGYYYRVRLPDKDADGAFVEYLARFIAADTSADVALLKVDLPEGATVPYLDLLPGDYPPVAAQAMVLGYPATSMFDQGTMAMQVDTGNVKSNNPDHEYEVWFDLSTTHGNSGGPIVDRNGDVIGILSAGHTVYNVTYVLAVGPKQIRDFFASIGDKAPALSSLARDVDRPFDPEKLAAEAREATLLVLIFRGSLEKDGPPVDEQPAEEGGPAGGAATGLEPPE